MSFPEQMELRLQQQNSDRPVRHVAAEPDLYHDLEDC